MRRDMVGRVVDDILDRIADGRYSQDRTLPSEVDLATELDVSRLTVRRRSERLPEGSPLGIAAAPASFLLETGKLGYRRGASGIKSAFPKILRMGCCV